MSNTIIFKIRKDGTPVEYGSVNNSFRSGFHLWMYLEEKYLPLYRECAKRCWWYSDDMSDEEFVKKYGYRPSRLTFPFKRADGKEVAHDIWELVSNKNLLPDERITLATTFDKVLVRKEDIPRIIDAFRSFKAFGEGFSFPEQADLLESLLDEEDCLAVGWNQTDVTDCLWGVSYDDNSEESYYNVLADNEHWWIDSEDSEVAEFFNKNNETT